MMISTKGRYALRILVDLAENGGGGFVTLKAVAERLDFEDVARDVELEGNLFQMFCGFHEETT